MYGQMAVHHMLTGLKGEMVPETLGCECEIMSDDLRGFHHQSDKFVKKIHALNQSVVVFHSEKCLGQQTRI
jgi:hypothetical protein